MLMRGKRGASLLACVAATVLAGCAGSLNEKNYLELVESSGFQALLSLARWTGGNAPSAPADPSAAAAFEHQLAAARREAADQNRELVEGLFEMGFEAAELASALGRVAAGGVDRALQPRDWLAGGAAGILGGEGGRPKSEPGLAYGWRSGLSWEHWAGGDALALNSDLRSFVAAMPAGDPVPGGEVSSGFGFRRHPISRRLGAHEGTDFITRGDRTVRAGGHGVVRVAARQGGFGKLVVVEHAHGFETRYAHLARIAVRAGQRVAEGEVLGVMGSTGYSTGVHLHFELRFRGRPLDAVKAMALARAGDTLVAER